MICGNIWDPRFPKYACDRELREVNGEHRPHTGKHMYRFPKGTRMQWWGEGFKEPQHQPKR